MLDNNTFVLANFIQNHPVLRERRTYINKYCSVLELYTLRYNGNDETAKASLLNYKKAFGCENSDTVTEALIKSYSKNIVGNRFDFKRFKLFTYRYCLLCDLFMINCFDNKDKAQKILAEIKMIFKERYHPKIDRLFALLYDEVGDAKEFDLVQHQVDCWQKNKRFLEKPEKKILITANMSAGKSTLINALIGKPINRTMNDTCTAKIHYIYEKAFEDHYTHEWDYEVNLNADKEILFEDDKRNKEKFIWVATHFNLSSDHKSRLCIIDTPGVNSAANKDHGELTKQTILNEQYDLLVYVVNAENVGTEDDLRHLIFIKENVPQNKIIFVLNKLDRFKKSEDSISESIENLRRDLISRGFEYPTICPVSSYLAFLYKFEKSGAKLSNVETRILATLKIDFADDEFYDLSKYYSHINAIVADDLLMKSGLFGLEQTILQRS
ncbi:MAG: dynamin family protein [Anaerotignum sp.]|nr:dynamin family protein [Anaerotignum sp.]